MTRVLLLATVAWVAVLVLGTPVIPRVSVHAPGLSPDQVGSIIAGSRLIVALTTSITCTLSILIVMSRAVFSQVFVICSSCALWISQALCWSAFPEAF